MNLPLAAFSNGKMTVAGSSPDPRSCVGPGRGPMNRVVKRPVVAGRGASPLTALDRKAQAAPRVHHELSQ